MSSKKYHNVVVEEGGMKVQMSCQHLEFSLYQTDSRCTVDILVLWESFTTFD